MPYAPTLTPKTDATPIPRVEIIFSTIDAIAVAATVYRLLGDRVNVVRGALKVYAAGGFSVVDFECPFGVVVTYRAEMFDVAGASLGFTDSGTTTLTVVGTWLHQPLNPTLAVNVILENTAGAELVQPFLGSLVQPLGRPVPVWVGAGRTGLQGVNVDCVTLTATQEGAFNSMFGTYGMPQIPIICVRTSDKLGIPQPFFGTFVSVRRVGFNLRSGGETVRWKVDADEVAPPVESLIISTLTYSDIEAAFATYSAVEAAYLTYLALESDYSLAGTS